MKAQNGMIGCRWRDLPRSEQNQELLPSSTLLAITSNWEEGVLIHSTEREGEIIFDITFQLHGRQSGARCRSTAHCPFCYLFFVSFSGCRAFQGIFKQMNTGRILRWCHLFSLLRRPGTRALSGILRPASYSDWTCPPLFSLGTWLSVRSYCCCSDGAIYSVDIARCWKIISLVWKEKVNLGTQVPPWGTKTAQRRMSKTCFYRILWRNTCRCFTTNTTVQDFLSRMGILSAALKRIGVNLIKYVFVSCRI